MPGEAYLLGHTKGLSTQALKLAVKPEGGGWGVLMPISCLTEVSGFQYSALNKGGLGRGKERRALLSVAVPAICGTASPVAPFVVLMSLHQNDLEDHFRQDVLTWKHGNTSLKNMIVVVRSACPG